MKRSLVGIERIVDVESHARPVVYLKPDIELKKGDYDGSIDKPYELAEAKG